MSTIHFKGAAMKTVGTIPAVGSQAPDFTLVGQQLNEIKLQDFKGKNIVLNIFPSLDTDVCAASVRHFNQEASELKDTVVLCVSMDLPFAATRFCSVNGINNVETASGFRSDFGDTYGVEIADGPMKGLYARALVVIDKNRKVIGQQLVDEITNEPDYSLALKLLS
ncbi:MAG: thiol peroxidase [Candidatus Amulumruptor caecigallinarius]|nr:thiol peroxidase [Candidatus Amulumruptor caecigallinarius]